MGNGKSPVLAETIPGWRVMRSDAGRYWATRNEPFLDAVTRGPLDAPPFRTVDADTYGELLDEVHRQERAAEQATRKIPRQAGRVTS
ncbi:hypothetical protein [Streptosporangium carneum]|uniref:Uncharacterized protein n=1 Tax=Streptosporangium carneum TaxID=47481 RepID=A0A9W6MB94_9ACTN|nr:hypothetical protein [Streptosporangium carneum]GLK07570.1 hypothetical protein GCM10017600_09750 [Streptosporangium carneum]